MKLFKTIAATAAVITCCIGNPLPAKSGVVVDLYRGTRIDINDGNPYFYIVQGGRTWKGHKPAHELAYPINGAGPGEKRTYKIDKSFHQTAARLFHEADMAGETYRNGIN